MRKKLQMFQNRSFFHQHKLTDRQLFSFSGFLKKTSFKMADYGKLAQQIGLVSTLVCHFNDFIISQNSKNIHSYCLHYYIEFFYSFE